MVNTYRKMNLAPMKAQNSENNLSHDYHDLINCNISTVANGSENVPSCPKTHKLSHPSNFPLDPLLLPKKLQQHPPPYLCSQPWRFQFSKKNSAPDGLFIIVHRTFPLTPNLKFNDQCRHADNHTSATCAYVAKLTFGLGAGQIW